MDQVDVAVIGAGQAGLAVSYHLTRARRSHVVLERGRVGESWRSQRWDSFVMNTPNGLTLLPGQSVGTDDPHGFWSRDAFVSRLQRYAHDNAIPVREHAEVTAVDRADGGFTVTTTGAAPDVVKAGAVVVASGMQQRARVPAVAAAVPDRVAQVHTSRYRNPDALPPGAVLVVGSAQSGCQIAEDLLDAGRRVYLATSRVGRTPRRYRGRDVFEWLVAMGSTEITPSQLPDPAQIRAAQPQISGVGPRGHTVSLQSLAGRGATLLGRLDDVRGNTLSFTDDVAEHIRFADTASTEMKRQIDDFIAREHIDAPSVASDETDAADLPCRDPGTLAGPHTLELDEARVGAIVWCTGFSADFGWLHLPVLDGHGLPVHQGGMSSVDGIAFVGFPWLRRRASGIVYGIDQDARVIVDQLTACLDAKA